MSICSVTIEATSVYSQEVHSLTKNVNSHHKNTFSLSLIEKDLPFDEHYNATVALRNNDTDSIMVESPIYFSK